jgi:hypothetical protein
LRWYYRKLPDSLVISHARPGFAAALEELQRICFPTLSDEERSGSTSISSMSITPLRISFKAAG